MDTRHPPFKNRRDAGRQLAAALLHLKDSNPVVLALPRGGVPVGYEVAQALAAPLDILLVRKIGAPGFRELGVGAIVEGQPYDRVLNESVVRQVGASDAYLQMEERAQIEEIERRRKLYWGDRPRVAVEGRTAVVVDDGVATGGTMRVALRALRRARAARLVFAVPVAPAGELESLRSEADEAVCLLVPHLFRAVSLYYDDFEQTTDEEVIGLLGAQQAQNRAGGAGAGAGPASADATPS